MGARRRAVTPAEAEAAAAAVARHLLADSALASATRVALYASLPDELPTPQLFARLAAAKPVLLPRWEGEGRLAFCAVARWTDLAPGRYGVLEPPVGSPEISPERGDVVLVPGVAFDAEGWRLGRGGGGYDRAFPPDAENPPLLYGLGYAFQVVASVPHDSRDRRMDAIVTERGIRRVARVPG
jgi:5-formyltetrahydrofolate cyclo-ligase